MLRARDTNLSRDKMDRKHGFGTPNEGPISLRLRTVIAAFHCGLLTDDPNAIAEGLDMLVNLERDCRSIEESQQHVIPYQPWLDKNRN